ncbi:TPA: hypothetical protein H1009_03275 [archaeon]|nr:hypothetical protein [Candidatus Naiadarchaeales archaeon SRR2090153.bin461]
MGWLKRTKKTYEIADGEKKLVKLELGKITYIFDRDSVVVDLRTNKGKPGVPIKKIVLDTAKASVAQVVAVGPAMAGHELGHAGTALAVQAKVVDLVLFGADAGIRFIADSPAQLMAVSLVPSILEAVLGLYLIRRGIKKEEAIQFSIGVFLFTTPLWRYIFWNLMANGATDFNLFERGLKGFLLENRVGSFDTIVNLDTNAIILTTLIAMYTSVLLGSKYAPVMKQKILEGKKQLKYWQNVRGKIKEFKASGHFAGKIPIKKSKAVALLKSLREQEKQRKSTQQIDQKLSRL